MNLDPAEARCEAVQDRLSSFIDGRLSGATAHRVARHLTRCSKCAKVAADYRLLGERLRVEPAETPPRRLAAQARRRAMATHAPTWAGRLMARASLVGARPARLAAAATLLVVMAAAFWAGRATAPSVGGDRSPPNPPGRQFDERENFARAAAPVLAKLAAAEKLAPERQSKALQEAIEASDVLPAARRLRVVDVAADPILETAALFDQLSEAMQGGSGVWPKGDDFFRRVRRLHQEVSVSASGGAMSIAISATTSTAAGGAAPAATQPAESRRRL